MRARSVHPSGLLEADCSLKHCHGAGARPAQMAFGCVHYGRVSSIISRRFEMIPKPARAAVITAFLAMSGTAIAGPDDYVFEPVKAEVKKGDDVIVAVLLLHKATRKPVTDAVITIKRIDMAPDGMGDMASPLTQVPSDEPGVYAFKTELAMAGRWLLSIAAKVQGEPETVVGKITFRATR